MRRGSHQDIYVLQATNTAAPYSGSANAGSCWHDRRSRDCHRGTNTFAPCHRGTDIGRPCHRGTDIGRPCHRGTDIGRPCHRGTNIGRTHGNTSH